MAKLTIVYWRDIPAQVIAKRGRESAKIPLNERFEKAIDRAAMRARKIDSNSYLNDWRREAMPCSDDLETEAKVVADRLESEFPDERLEQIIRNKGIIPAAECGKAEGDTKS